MKSRYFIYDVVMKEVNPKDTSRAYAFEMWMNAPMPMVTFFKTLDVSPLLKISKRRGLKFNMLMCFCIGRARKRYGGLSESGRGEVSLLLIRRRDVDRINCRILNDLF